MYFIMCFCFSFVLGSLGMRSYGSWVSHSFFGIFLLCGIAVKDLAMKIIEFLEFYLRLFEFSFPFFGGENKIRNFTIRLIVSSNIKNRWFCIFHFTITFFGYEWVKSIESGSILSKLYIYILNFCWIEACIFTCVRFKLSS